jgi:hypothetical protein
MTSETSSVNSMSPSKGSSGKGNRKSSSLPPETVEYLKAWMMSPEHIAHPYPTEQEKTSIMLDTGIVLKQLTNWFVNNRKRYWKPRVEARIQQQAHAAASAHAAAVAAVVNSTTHTNPISPDATYKPTLHLGTPGLVHFDLPRTVSQSSLVGSDISKALSRRDSSQSLQLVSETSSSGSVSASDGGDTTEETSETSSSGSVSASDGGDTTEETSSEQDYTMESFTKSEVDSSSSAPLHVEQTTGQNSSQVSPPSTPIKKRMVPTKIEEPIPSTPRRKFRRISLDTWKDACQEASDVYCASLPTLEEASKLFGYSN